MPLRLTGCGVPGALSAKLSEAERLPVYKGVKVTLTVQVLVGATVAPVQVSVLFAKSVLFAPTIVTVVMRRLALPVLVMVSVMAELGVETSWFPKLREGEEKEIAAAVPVPLRVTDWGLLAALSLKFSEALRVPIAEGVKVTLTVQVALGSTITAVQVSVPFVKSPGFDPSSVTVEMVRLLVPVLVTVSTCAVLGAPTG